MMNTSDIDAAEALLGGAYGPDAEDCERFTSRYGAALIEIARGQAELLEALQYLSELYDRIYFDLSKTTEGEIQAMKRAWEIADRAIAKATAQ